MKQKTFLLGWVKVSIGVLMNICDSLGLIHSTTDEKEQ